MKYPMAALCSLAIFVLTTASLCSAYAQQAAEPATAQAVPDPIVGKWKLNVDKSNNPAAATEILIISPKGAGFDLDFNITQDNEYNPHYVIASDMKGTIAKPVYLDGKQTTSSWRVTRKGPRGFEMELIDQFGSWKDEYEIADDGQTMTMHRIMGKGKLVGGKIDSNGKVSVPQTVLVFEKVQ